MVFNPRGSTGRAHASNQPPTRVKSESNNNTSFHFPSTKTKSQSQEDSIMIEKIEQEASRSSLEIQKEEGAQEKVDIRISCPSTPARCTKEAHSAMSRAESCRTQAMSVPPCMLRNGTASLELVNLLLDKRIQPPVTATTLQELDLNSIRQNINLRVDICHDLELFFQPISGPKGDEKRTEAKKYWLALQVELQIYSHNVQPQCHDCQRIKGRMPSMFESRLPGFFDNLRETVQMLVPDTDHEEVANHLDTELLMQQVRVGAMDAMRLSIWLAELLTSHCAPMRDAAAAEIADRVRLATEQADMAIFVESLEKLFCLLEAMKLDIANHQIRSFRYILIEGAVEFQQNYFAKMIKDESIDLAPIQQWQRMQTFNHHSDCGRDKTDEAGQRFACFLHSLVHTCNPGERDVPLTLKYDGHRITRLREDLQDHIQINLCLAVFNRQVQNIAGPLCDPASLHDELKQRIICLTEDDEGNGGAISDHLEAIGIELTRAAFSLQSTSRRSTYSLTRLDFDSTITLLQKVFHDEDCHQGVTKQFLESLEERTMHFAEQFQLLSTLDISNAQKQWAQGRTNKEILLADWDEMARKLAHIGVVHWRVWRDLCYWDQSEHVIQEYQDDDELDLSSDIMSYQEEEEEPVICRKQCRLLTTTALKTVSTAQRGERSDQKTAVEQRDTAATMEASDLQRHDSGFAELTLQELACIQHGGQRDKEGQKKPPSPSEIRDESQADRDPLDGSGS